MVENESNPQFKAKDMKLDETIKLTILSPTEISSGTSKFGRWEMWAIGVTNQKVYNKDNSVIENYTGKTIMFPSEKLREKFSEVTGGVNENIEINLTKKAKTTERGGLYTSYEVEVLTGGSPKVVTNGTNPFMTASMPVSDMNSVEQKLVSEAKSAKLQVESTGGTFLKEHFIQAAKTNYNVKEDRAGELWTKFMV